MHLRSLILAALFAALTAVGSMIKIPIGALLILTFQTFFMFLSGLLLAPRYAFLSQLVYMAIGLLGLPVFSQGGGLSYVLMPSFGFVLGFLVCAPLTSVLVRRNLCALTTKDNRRGLTVLKIVLLSVVAIASMYVIGVAYMYVIYRVYIGEVKTVIALVKGMGLFILADSLKLAAAIPLSVAITKRAPFLITSLAQNK